MTHEQPTITLEGAIAATPKLDIHSHLVGCIRPATLEELVRRTGASLPRPAARLAPYENFYEFISVYNLATTLLRTQDDFARVMYEALEDGWHQSKQLHTEMFFNPQYSMAIGVPYKTIVDGLCEGLRHASSRFDVSCVLVPSIGREIDERAAGEVMDAILAERRDEVVGIGIDGPERAGPPERFIDIYRRAASAGLKRTAHVCEDNQTLSEAPPVNYLVCADDLGCDRFDHGYNLLADDAITRRARDDGKVFTTVALTSSLARREQRWKNIRAMMDAGLKITVNTDNPAMFGTTLNHSLQAVCTACGWGADDLRKLLDNAVDACWLHESGKRRLRLRLANEPALHSH